MLNPTDNKRAALLLLADSQMWFVVQNGNQLDIHAQVIPDGEKARDVTLIGNLRLDCANLIVTEHNKSLLAANSYLPNQSEIKRLAEDRNAIAETIENCHKVLDLATGETEPNTTSAVPLDTRLRSYLFGECPITACTTNRDHARDCEDEERAAAVEATWKERQGDEYGSY